MVRGGLGWSDMKECEFGHCGGMNWGKIKSSSEMQFD